MGAEHHEVHPAVFRDGPSLREITKKHTGEAKVPPVSAPNPERVIAPPPPDPMVGEKYIVLETFRFMRNNSFVVLQAGRVISRATEATLIDEVLRLGAKLDPIENAKLHRCPHCSKVSAIR